jgi:hypothetical protein
MTENKN